MSDKKDEQTIIYNNSESNATLSPIARDNTSANLAMNSRFYHPSVHGSDQHDGPLMMPGQPAYRQQNRSYPLGPMPVHAMPPAPAIPGQFSLLRHPQPTTQSYQQPPVLMTPPHLQPSTPSQAPVSPPVLDDFILSALKKPQERIFLLKLEKDLMAFVDNHQLFRLDLPQMNSYQRLMVHKVAPYFNLSHFYDHSRQSVCLYKNAYTAIPERRFAQLVEPEQEEQKAKGPKIQIMRRAPSGGNTNDKDTRKNTSTPDVQERKSMTYEERKAKYEEARARIFKDLEQASAATQQSIEVTIEETAKEQKGDE